MRSASNHTPQSTHSNFDNPSQRHILCRSITPNWRGASVLAGAYCTPIALILPQADLSFATSFFSVVIAASVALFTKWSLSATIKVRTDGWLEITYLSQKCVVRLADVQLCHDRKIDFKHDRRLGLKQLCQGTNFHSFRVGWFILNNDAIGFCFVSRKRRARALYVKDRFYLLIDPSLYKLITPRLIQPVK